MSDTLNPETEELNNKIELFDIIEEKEEEIIEQLEEVVKDVVEEVKDIVLEVSKNIAEEEKEDFIKEKVEPTNDQKVSILSCLYRNLTIFSCSSK